MSQQSKYATKRESGKMMYGPGCCANKMSDGQLASAKARRAQEWKDSGDWFMAQNMRGRVEYADNQGEKYEV